MSKSKTGSLNPMYKKPKSKEFIEHMLKYKKGTNNPMYGKKKSKETLSKISKELYVYDTNNKLIIKYISMSEAIKELKIAHGTILKNIDTDIVYKNKLFILIKSKTFKVRMLQGMPRRISDYPDAFAG